MENDESVHEFAVDLRVVYAIDIGLKNIRSESPFNESAYMVQPHQDFDLLHDGGDLVLLLGTNAFTRDLPLLHNIQREMYCSERA